MVTIEIVDECYLVKVNGRTVAGITPETPAFARKQFISLCKQREAELDDLLIRYEAAIRRNIQLLDAGGNGKNWPVFNERERVVNALCKLAGIIDS